MNKSLFIARKAKGLTEIQLAKLLHIDEQQYKELESSIAEISVSQVQILGKLFSLPAEYFLDYDQRSDRLITVAMDEVNKIIQSSSADQMPPKHCFSFINMGNQALMLQVELNSALFRAAELQRQNESLKALYLHLKERMELVNG